MRNGRFDYRTLLSRLLPKFLLPIVAAVFGTISFGFETIPAAIAVALGVLGIFIGANQLLVRLGLRTQHAAVYIHYLLVAFLLLGRAFFIMRSELEGADMGRWLAETSLFTLCGRIYLERAEVSGKE